MTLSDFDYPLPKELIAQAPLKKRDSSRLLVVHRKDKKIEDRLFLDLPEYIPSGDVLVANDTKVFKARVLGNKKQTGGKVDVLLISPIESPENNHQWRVLLQPSLKDGQEVVFPESVEAQCMGRDAEGILLMQFKNTDDVRAWAERVGTMPLPPYIKREAESNDVETYQTIYAKNEGAVAAPTAGLHFTENLFQVLHKKGVEIQKVTLHVGYGTFKPVEDLENHKMHAESFELSVAAAEKINTAKKNNKKIWAVGTTTLRVLEACVVKKELVAGKGQTDLFIKPPFEFEMADHLITNFHLPKTTLLLLISAFMGEELRKKAYQHAIDQKYRFYSYGDAMLII